MTPRRPACLGAGWDGKGRAGAVRDRAGKTGKRARRPRQHTHPPRTRAPDEPDGTTTTAGPTNGSLGNRRERGSGDDARATTTERRGRPTKGRRGGYARSGAGKISGASSSKNNKIPTQKKRPQQRLRLSLEPAPQAIYTASVDATRGISLDSTALGSWETSGCRPLDPPLAGVDQSPLRQSDAMRAT